MNITDVQLATLWLRQWRPEPGEYAAPAAVAVWDGTALKCRPSGMPLDPAAALMCPALAHALKPIQTAKAAPLPVEPTIAALLADYPAATASLRSPAGSIAPAETFTSRLKQGCRRCHLWDEPARNGRGRCNSVRCPCSRRLLWLAAETCPEHLWTV